MAQPEVEKRDAYSENNTIADQMLEWAKVGIFMAQMTGDLRALQAYRQALVHIVGSPEKADGHCQP